MKNLVLLAVLIGGASLFGSQSSDVATEISRLHAEDIEATLSGDPQRLANLFTQDGVLLEPGSPAQTSRAEILAENLKQKKAHPDARNLEYKPEIHDLRIYGDWAVEWTTFSAAFQERAGAPVQRFNGKAIRVLRRQPDGSWKFSHVAWN